MVIVLYCASEIGLRPRVFLGYFGRPILPKQLLVRRCCSRAGLPPPFLEEQPEMARCWYGASEDAAAQERGRNNGGRSWGW